MVRWLDLTAVMLALWSAELVLAEAGPSEPPIPTPPAIAAVDPELQTVLQGQSAELAASFGNFFPVHVQWAWNGVLIADATNATLTLENVQGNQAGVYSVQGIDSTGRRLNAAGRLRVSTLAASTWTFRLDSPVANSSVANAVAVDSSGSVYATGSSYQGATGTDAATVQIGAGGQANWFRAYDGGTGVGWDSGNAVALTASGDLIVVGQTAAQGFDAHYLAIRYDQKGNQRWTARYQPNTSSIAEAWGLVLDRSDNAYLWGNFETVKLSSQGEQIWVESGLSGQVMGAKTDSADNLYVMRLGYQLAKYDPSGRRLWAITNDAPTSAWSSAIALDAADAIFVTGLSGTKKFDRNGQILWTNPEATGWAMAVDRSGRPVIAGGESLVKLDADGKELWRAAVGATLVVLDADDHVYFSNGSGLLAGGRFLWVVGMLDPRGSVIWSGTFGSAGRENDQVLSLAVSAAGVLHVAGRLHGNFAVEAYTPVNQPGAPSIVSVPVGATSEPGTDVHLSVTAQGDSPLLFQWLRNGVEIGGATNRVLFLPQIRPEQAGDYSVLVSNAQGWTLSPLASVALRTVPPVLGEVRWAPQPSQWPWLQSPPDFQATVFGTPGQPFQVERSSNLRDWAPLPVIQNPTGAASFSFPFQVDMGFFRVRFVDAAGQR